MSFVRTQARFLESMKKEGTPWKFWGFLKEALKTKDIKPGEFSIRETFEEFIPDGRELVRMCNPAGGGNNILSEAGDAVKSSDFSNITGQLMITATLEGFDETNLLGPLLVNDIQTQFNGERIPGVTDIGDEAQEIAEGALYPIAGVSEKFVDTPQTTKSGMIVPLTKEAIFFDRTNQLLAQANQVGQWLGVNKEKRVLDVVLGLTDNYKRNNITDVTYANTHNTGDFDNLAAGNALVDWTDLEQAELLFDAITDPDTGEPVSIIPNTLIVPTGLMHTAERIKSATEVRQGAISATVPVTLSASPTGNQYTIVSGPRVKQRTSSATTWFIGDPKKAFAYMQNWPITTVQAPVNASDEFNRDIAMQFKSSERGVAAVIEPRFMVKATVA